MVREINLLPPERRHNLERQAFLRVVYVALRNVAAALLVVTLLGGGAVALITSMAAAEERSQDYDVKGKVQEFRELRNTIGMENERLRFMLDQVDGRILWSARLQDFLDSLPPGVRIERLKARDKPPLRQLVFSGTAVTRNALIVLENRLQELDWVERVEAPVSNLIKRTDAEYVFTVRITPPGTEGDQANPSPSPS